MSQEEQDLRETMNEMYWLDYEVMLHAEAKGHETGQGRESSRALTGGGWRLCV